MTSRPKIVLDCDPGHDDVCAALVAHRHADLLAITTTHGNSPIGNTTRNALITRQVFGVDVPVFRGAARPLLADPHPAEFIHGASGLGGPVLPDVTGVAQPGHGAIQLVTLTQEHPDAWIVATGPLTNVALALRLDPTLPERIAGIAIMGGGSFGNVTPQAEFNIWADPEAAAIVYGSGARIVMCGLDITHQVLISPSDVDTVRSWGGHRSEFLADLLAFFGESYKNAFFDEALGPLHDPCAVLAVTHPHLFTIEPRYVGVEVGGRHTRGMTAIDQRGVKGGPNPNVELLVGVDVAGVRAALFATFAAVCGA